MSQPDIIRAWKDAEYRRSLSPEELAALPEHPAGFVALTDEELESVSAGNLNHTVAATYSCCVFTLSFHAWTYGCCTSSVAVLPES